MNRRMRVRLIHLTQLGLLIALYQAKTYYANHLGFMRNVSYYTKKLASGPIGGIINGLAVFLLLGVIAKTYQLWRKKRLNKEEVTWWTVCFLAVGFVCWQWLVSPLDVSLYYLISAVILLVMCGQIGIFVSMNESEKTIEEGELK